MTAPWTCPRCGSKPEHDAACVDCGLARKGWLSGLLEYTYPTGACIGGKGPTGYARVKGGETVRYATFVCAMCGAAECPDAEEEVVERHRGERFDLGR